MSYSSGEAFGFSRERIFTKDEIDPEKNPKLALFARILTTPYHYSKLEWQCLKGYMWNFFGSTPGGRAMILEAQFAKQLIQKYVYTTDFSELNVFLTPDFHFDDKQLDIDRVSQLRNRSLIYIAQKIFNKERHTFQKLIDEGFLTPTT